MFQVNVEDLITNKFNLSVQDTHYTPTEINNFYYWEYELYIKLLNKKNKDDKDKSESQENGNSMPNMSNFSPSKLMGGIPNMPKF